jgi:hypothetical protein
MADVVDFLRSRRRRRRAHSIPALRQRVAQKVLALTTACQLHIVDHWIDAVQIAPRLRRRRTRRSFAVVVLMQLLCAFDNDDAEGFLEAIRDARTVIHGMDSSQRRR